MYEHLIIYLTQYCQQCQSYLPSVLPQVQTPGYIFAKSITTSAKHICQEYYHKCVLSIFATNITSQCNIDAHNATNLTALNQKGNWCPEVRWGYANKVKKNKKYVLDKKKLQLGHFSEGVWSGGHLLLSGISVTQKIALGGWSTPTKQFSYLHYSTYISSTSSKILH